jgi:hypothetical protein
MSAQLAKLVNPAFYQQTWATTCARAYAKFHPDVRQNGYVGQATAIGSSPLFWSKESNWFCSNISFVLAIFLLQLIDALVFYDWYLCDHVHWYLYLSCL